nr:MAG TPA: hypothetical protein [Caudoviricetes sp.]
MIAVKRHSYKYLYRCLLLYMQINRPCANRNGYYALSVQQR